MQISRPPSFTQFQAVKGPSPGPRSIEHEPLGNVSDETHQPASESDIIESFRRGRSELRFEIIKASADAGDLAAQKRIAAAYASGRGVPQDDATASRYVKAAAAKGDIEAQVVYADMHLSGRLHGGDIDTTVKYLLNASAHDDPVAIHILNNL